MKNIILLFVISFFIIGCSSDDNDPFYGFKIENIAGIDIASIKKIPVIDQYSPNRTSTKTALYGLKDGKIWISIFENSNKEEIYKYTYNEKIPTTINLPYGEVFNVASFSINANEFGKLIIISGEYLNYVPQDGLFYPSDSRVSFDGILINKKENTRITGLLAYPWYENSVICKVDEDILIFGQNGEQIVINNIPKSEYSPLSFTHGILISNGSFYSLENYNTGNRISKEILEITALIKEGKTNMQHIDYKIKDSNSSFANIDYHITLTTGEVANYTLKIDLSDGNYQWIEVQ